ncbi:MAG: potassium transporter, partial [Proteobacteria bacterium]|nr:potassium transporter [Pseudomonadota bacterium]
PASAKSMLVDKNPDVGGMWSETYDYVRLHQPHKMFTAGSIPWTINKEPAYLASKPEVLDQFRYCLERLRAKLSLAEFYAYTYEEHREVLTDEGYEAHVICTPSHANQKPLLIKAKKLIKALGFRIPTNDPLKFSSPNVRSLSPNDQNVLGTELAESEAPIYVVGGGKTGMDTVHALLTNFPNKQINFIVGRGTIFINRNKSFPRGWGRWWGEPTTLEYTIDLCLRYDGNNENEVFEAFKSERCVHLDGTGEQFVFGLLSEEENVAIAAGINELIPDYLTDVVDIEGQTTMIFRSGEQKPIEAGSWFINCSGYVLREEHVYEPYISEQRTVASIQPTSGIHFLTTFASYFLVHLFYLGKLDTLPLYEIDYESFVPKNKVAWPFAALTQSLYNTLLIMDAVPNKVMTDCGVDFDRWFPFYRRLMGGLKLKRNANHYLDHFRSTLDSVRDRNSIRCGELPSVASRIS